MQQEKLTSITTRPITAELMETSKKTLGLDMMAVAKSLVEGSECTENEQRVTDDAKLNP